MRALDLLGQALKRDAHYGLALSQAAFLHQNLDLLAKINSGIDRTVSIWRVARFRLRATTPLSWATRPPFSATSSRTSIQPSPSLIAH
jgi:hypothetical protein